MWGRVIVEIFSLESAGSNSSSSLCEIISAFPIKSLSLSMFSSVYYTVLYSIFISSLSCLFFQPFSSLQWFQHHSLSRVCSGSCCSHLPCLQFIQSSPFFLFFHLSFLPSGSLAWCDAGCQSQRYMWYRVGGGGPRVWTLWQRQQVA